MREAVPPPANDDFEFIAPPPKTRGNLALKPVAEEAAYDCPIRFPGQWQDAETGLYYNRHRYYDPLAAQYTSPDPIGLEGGARPQGYVDCPNVWVDPFGLAAKRTNLPAERYPPREGAIGVWKEKTFFPGERFDRYGYPGGRYTADVNTPFPNRALGPESLQMPYQVYEVVKPFGAIKSYTASWFGQPGGGIQYITPVPLSTLLKRGIIRKVN